jgi:hypothetical protein
MCVSSSSYCQIQNFDHLQLSANIREGTFRKFCHIDRQVCINVDIVFGKIKYLGDIEVIINSQYVTWKDFREKWCEIKLVITAVRNTHIIVY